MSLLSGDTNSLFNKPYQSLFDRLNTRERLGEAGNRFLQGNPSIEDLRLLGYTQYCGSTSDCGYGSQCVDGLCRPIGAGNTQYGEGGCSSGPSSNPPATLDCINCGYDSEKSCAGIKTCRFTQFGVTCKCGQSSGTNTGDPEGEEGKPCNKYCTTEYSSYGTYGPGCSDRNTCSECYSCDGENADNGTCAKKSRDDGAPCHCAPNPDESCTPRDEVPITCCSYQDTCFGRIDQSYCHETYRTFYPRCYNPDYPYCTGPEYPEDPDCLECERSWISWNQNQTEPVIPDDAFSPCYNEAGDTVCGPDDVLCTDPITGDCTCRPCCPDFGGANEIINEETGDTKTFIECCENVCIPEGCSDNLDCPAGTCCVGQQCDECSYPIPSSIPCDILSYPPVGFGGAGGGGGAYWSKPGSICDCYDIWVETFGSGYQNVYTGQNCATVDNVIDLEIYNEFFRSFGGEVIAVEVGHATDPLTCNSFTNVCPTFVPGNYEYYQACEDSGFLPRNGILKWYYYDTATGEIDYIFEALWGGNFNGGVGREYDYDVQFQIRAQRRLTNCTQYNLPSDFRLQY